MYQTKAATHSLSIVSQLVAIVLMSLKLAGIDLAEDASGLPDNVASLVDAGMILSAQLAALYGRFRATTRITGIFKSSPQ